MTIRYDQEEPSRSTIDDLAGPAVLEFGADWCGHCQAAEPLIGAALGEHPDVRQVVERRQEQCPFHDDARFTTMLAA